MVVDRGGLQGHGDGSLEEDGLEHWVALMLLFAKSASDVCAPPSRLLPHTVRDGFVKQRQLVLQGGKISEHLAELMKTLHVDEFVGDQEILSIASECFILSTREERSRICQDW